MFQFFKKLCVAMALFFLIQACGSSSSDSSSGGTSASRCATTEANMLGTDEMDTSSSAVDCATVSIVENIANSGGDTAAYTAVNIILATTLDTELTRANVLTTSDVLTATTFETWREALGYECADGDTCNNLAMEFGSTYANAEILVVPTVYIIDGTYYLFVSIRNMETGESVAHLSSTGTSETAATSMEALSEQAAEAIKDQQHCLSLSPKAATIDYDDAAARTQVFTATVTNLKDEAANTGSVNFAIDYPEWGTVSPADVDVASGLAQTTFTMTSKKENSITATYSSTTESDKDTKAGIIPLCGLVMSVNGTRTFNVTEESMPFFGDGGWWTLQGTSTVEGYIPLLTLEEDGTDYVYGTGWYSDDQNCPLLETYIISQDEAGNPVTCDLTGSEIGLSTGGWTVWGAVEDGTASLAAMAFGEAASGATLDGSCPGINTGGLNSFTTYASFGDTTPVSIELEPGATATATGDDGVSEYSYDLKIYRADH